MYLFTISHRYNIDNLYDFFLLFKIHNLNQSNKDIEEILTKEINNSISDLENKFNDLNKSFGDNMNKIDILNNSLKENINILNNSIEENIYILNNSIEENINILNNSLEENINILNNLIEKKVQLEKINLKHIYTINEHTARINSVAIFPYSGNIISSSFDSSIIIYDKTFNILQKNSNYKSKILSYSNKR